jgi:valyl-tRNA synthetase
MSSAEQSIPNRFDFHTEAGRIYADWEQAGCFTADPHSQRPPFSIVIPPPNVTGALHLGHALNNTLQDIQIRMARMQGFEALWMPGTDHAGIATQAVVERRLREQENLTRHQLGRSGLIERIWSWKDQYEKRILDQLRRMGCSCDWQRTRFTLDEVCGQAVRQTFFDLFGQGLIYRGKRLVNWDTFLQTAVSDDEVFHETVPGNFWHLRYPVLDPQPGEPHSVTLATTRPETLLGDTAVAVHPDPRAALLEIQRQLEEKLLGASAKERPALLDQLADVQQRISQRLPELEQLAKMAADGRHVRLPLVDRPIPLVADNWAKPELGSGCVKITPAHDPNDYQVGLRCHLPMISIMLPDGRLATNTGPYQGLTMAQARKAVVADLEAGGYLVQIEDRQIDLAHSDRSKTPIEPLLADQWFIRMDRLAQSAMDAVEDGRVEIIPQRYAKTYLDWLSEKRDWPIGRQLWWGHQIPIWSLTCSPAEQADRHIAQLQQLRGPDESHISWQIEQPDTDDQATPASCILHVCVRQADPAVEAQLEQWGFQRQEDVLDTWFSSALWPHSTLGWPEATAELKKFYPTSTLITSRDIITLWVARMVLMGLNNLGQVPFRQVFIHPKILDGFGETMSKSKGNGVDPIDVIDKFGPDALRFGLAWLTTDTQDVRLPVQFECPHCSAATQQTKANRQLPKITCDKCGGQFSTQWAELPEDRALPRGAVISERFEVARNFVNKLWNASRFVMLNLDGYTPQPIAADQLLLEDRWLLSRLASLTHSVTEALQQYRYAEAARELYRFAWDDFCSLYLEITKPRLHAESGDRHLAQAMLAYGLDQLLRLLHPIMPFVTEAIWQHLQPLVPNRKRPVPADEATMPQQHPPIATSPWLAQAAWPVAQPADIHPAVEQGFSRFEAVLAGVREIRARQNIPPKKTIAFQLACSPADQALLEPMRPYFPSLAQAELSLMAEQVEPPAVSAQMTLEGIELYVDLSGVIDVAAEVARQEKLQHNLLEQITRKQAKLASPNFVEKAPAAVVEKERSSLEELQHQAEQASRALAALRLLAGSSNPN